MSERVLSAAKLFCFGLAYVLLSNSAFAIDPGFANGQFLVDGASFKLSSAVFTTVENLFDNNKQDTLILISDRPLGNIAPDDSVEISLKARNGELFALSVRIDEGKLINTTLYYKGLEGLVLLPGKWFTLSMKSKSSGNISLQEQVVDIHKYSCKIEFNGALAINPTVIPTKEPTILPLRSPAPTLAPANTLFIEPKKLTPLLIKAMMEKDDQQALKLIKLGADPNGKDQYGTAVLNWAVMMCQPAVVKALVDAKADLTYARAPGLTILTEAAACPEAESILKAAGAK